MTTRTPGAFQQKAPLKAPPATAVASSVDLEKRKEWTAFLRNNCLLHHADLLLRNGFDDMEAMVEMEDADMKDLGIPAHDAVRLRRSLQHLRSPPAELDERHPVVAFLWECGLQQYASVMLSNGFDDMETLLEIQDQDMRDLGLQRGHALKLAKRLREFRAGQAGGAALACPELASQPRHSLAARRPAAPAAAPVTSKSVLQSTEAQMSAVQRSWERVQCLGAYVLGEKLYGHTFRMAPQVMALFPPEVRFKYCDWSADESYGEDADITNSPALKKLFGKVVNAVGVSVAGLREPGQMVPLLTQLGARHIAYGVREEYWKVLGEGLMLTLKECLGDEFSPEVELAWSLVYGFMSAVMIEGLRGAIAARAEAAAGGDGANSVSSAHSGLRTGSELLRSVSEDRETLASTMECDTEDPMVKTPSSDGSNPEVAKIGMAP